jgi:hypothetical protein
MAQGNDSEAARFDFRLADAFPSDDRIARYVMRLSMALGDLRIAAGEYAIRGDQPEYERQYFVRLTAAHLHEVALLFNPPDTTIPTVEEFIRAVIPAHDKATRKRVREQHGEVKRRLAEPLTLRPGSRLGAELKRMRNTFFHCHVDERNEAALTEAMHFAGDMRTAYVVRDRTLQADYADLVGGVLMHPGTPPPPRNGRRWSASSMVWSSH